MEEELQEKLFKRFPKIFEERNNEKSLLNFRGIECGDGWFDLIWKLCEGIEAIYKKEKIEIKTRALQVKEKFGGLRFYINDYSNEEVSNLIYNFEDMSFRVCEKCGSTASVVIINGWIFTLCENHEEEVRKEKEKT